MKKFEYKNKKDKNYFEGWYFRATDQNNKNYAVIFAVTKNEEDPHAFIQVFKNGDKECIYQKYDISLFRYEEGTVHIGNNTLSLHKVYVNVRDYILDLAFERTIPLETSAMGYLEKAPLDCFQEVVLLNGEASGTINKRKGHYRIYIEKTYGNKFPKKWLWIQSNHSKNNSDFSFSLGYIPLLKKTVPGWLFVLNTPTEQINFHSLGGASLKTKENEVIIKTLRYKIHLQYTQKDTIKLVGPSPKAKMDLDVFESLTSTANIKVYKNKKLLFEDSYINVGLEKMYWR